MTHYEKYKDAIGIIRAVGSSFAVVKGEIIRCEIVKCPDCIFSGPGGPEGCLERKWAWLNAEYNEGTCERCKHFHKVINDDFVMYCDRFKLIYTYVADPCNSFKERDAE